MRQRQPDRADLLPAGHDAVEDTARDDEVGAGVVVAERETDRRVVDRRGAAEDETRARRRLMRRTGVS